MSATYEPPPWSPDRQTATRVLTVADDVPLRDLLTRGLNRHQFEVVALSTSTDVDPSGIHLVLLDVPPGPDARALKALQRLRARGVSVPAVCLATHQDRMRLQGVSDAILIKPIDISELASELRQLLRTPSP